MEESLYIYQCAGTDEISDSDLPNQKWAVIINNPSLLNKSSQGHHQCEMHQTWEMPKCQENLKRRTQEHESRW